MYNFDYLLSILERLDRGVKLTVQSMEKEFGVKKGAVYAYIKTLKDAKFPIYYDKQKESYVFEDGFSFRKPNISQEEWLTLALAKNMMGHFGSGIEKSIRKIEGKLAGGEATLPDHIILSSDKGNKENDDHLASIHHAITHYERLELLYRNLYNNETKKRRVDPYYLYYHKEFWYLRGFCHLAEDMRTFGLDMILSLKQMNEHFTPQIIDPEEELSGAFGIIVDRELVDVVVRFDEACKTYVMRKKWHKSQQEKDIEDGGIELSFTVKGTEEIKRWLYRWIPHVEVISPVSLREEIQDELKRSLDKYL